ncbi:MAG: hypothetical protein H0X39_12810 [Actinobacteria bacterium]|nr:hypothetical protein [Actinomycetota bacterium]
MASSFPIVLANGPPPAGLQEVAESGVTMLRTGIADWNAPHLDAQIAAERLNLELAAQHGLACWVWLGTLTNLTPGSPPAAEPLLTRVVDALKGHPALGAWKGHDEPRNPFNAARSIPPANLVRGHDRVQALDPNHSLVIVQAPRGAVEGLIPYRPALDIAGVDIYPVAYPPGRHSDLPNNDISVVGDITRWIRKAAGTKPVWVTLQIAWSGVAPTKTNPGIVPRFPSKDELRFMAYQAIVNGASGLVFFGGHLTQIVSPADAAAGWNWTFWREALQPLVRQLSSASLAPALLAPASRSKVAASTKDVELATRQTAEFLYVIAVRRAGATSQVRFTGLPKSLHGGQVLFEYVQDPLPPPIGAGAQIFRSVAVTAGAFRDWLAPHDTRVYRFAL